MNLKKAVDLRCVEERIAEIITLSELDRSKLFVRYEAINLQNRGPIRRPAQVDLAKGHHLIGSGTSTPGHLPDFIYRSADVFEVEISIDAGMT